MMKHRNGEKETTNLSTKVYRLWMNPTMGQYLDISVSRYFSVCMSLQNGKENCHGMSSRVPSLTGKNKQTRTFRLVKNWQRGDVIS